MRPPRCPMGRLATRMAASAPPKIAAQRDSASPARRSPATMATLVQPTPAIPRAAVSTSPPAWAATPMTMLARARMCVCRASAPPAARSTATTTTSAPTMRACRCPVAATRRGKAPATTATSAQPTPAPRTLTAGPKRASTATTPTCAPSTRATRKRAASPAHRRPGLSAMMAIFARRRAPAAAAFVWVRSRAAARTTAAAASMRATARPRPVRTPPACAPIATHAPSIAASTRRARSSSVCMCQPSVRSPAAARSLAPVGCVASCSPPNVDVRRPSARSRGAAMRGVRTAWAAMRRSACRAA